MQESIYLVLRKDFDDHTDWKGCLALPIGAFQTISAANAAARAHANSQSARAPSYGDPPEHGEENGLYKGECYTREDWRDHFEVWVKQMKLGDAPKSTSTTGGSKKRKSEGVLDADGEGEKEHGGKRGGTVRGKGAKVSKSDENENETEGVVVID